MFNYIKTNLMVMPYHAITMNEVDLPGSKAFDSWIKVFKLFNLTQIIAFAKYYFCM